MTMEAATYRLRRPAQWVEAVMGPVALAKPIVLLGAALQEPHHSTHRLPDL
jgi:hypothetical protein